MATYQVISASSHFSEPPAKSRCPARRPECAGIGKAFPNTSNSLERGKLGVNAASPIHYSPLHAYAMDNDAARDPKYKATGLTFEQFLLAPAALRPNDLHTLWKLPPSKC